MVHLTSWKGFVFSLTLHNKGKKTPVTYLLKLRFTHKDDDGDYELMMMMGKQNVL